MYHISYESFRGNNVERNEGLSTLRNAKTTCKSNDDKLMRLITVLSSNITIPKERVLFLFLF